MFSADSFVCTHYSFVLKVLNSVPFYVNFITAIKVFAKDVTFYIYIFGNTLRVRLNKNRLMLCNLKQSADFGCNYSTLHCSQGKKTNLSDQITIFDLKLLNPCS